MRWRKQLGRKVMFQLWFRSAAIIIATGNHISYICRSSVTAYHHVIDEHCLLDILQSIYYLSICQRHRQWFQTRLHLKCCWISAAVQHILRGQGLWKTLFSTRSVSQAHWALSSLPGQEWTVTIDTYMFKHQKHSWVTLLLFCLSITLTQIQ